MKNTIGLKVQWQMQWGKELKWFQNSSGKIIQTVGDNFDAKLSTQNNLNQDTQHGTYSYPRKLV